MKAVLCTRVVYILVSHGPPSTSDCPKVFLLFVVPSPSEPYVLYPVPHTVPSSLSTVVQECDVDVVIALTSAHTADGETTLIMIIGWRSLAWHTTDSVWRCGGACGRGDVDGCEGMGVDAST